MIGKTLAHYEIKGLLGKGGMGEVYRARDTKLGRDVALKILPRELSGDPEREARFDREARTLASLQHPNIASIYGFEDVDGVRFLAMELVEGEDLAHHFADGPLPLDETLRIARQMAAGLEAAHDKGIVHRDLKPANVMLTAGHEVKILDFGLARAWFGDGMDDQSLSMSPTITTAMTQAGTILGTAAYMSPEQARGHNVDRRADIWAFGTILWEMVTGEQLFGGETISDTLAAVLRAEPEWNKLPVEEAPLLCRLIERCLVRDPRQRLRDIGEARILLQEGGADASHLSLSGITLPPTEPAHPPRTKTPWPAFCAVALLCLAAGAVLGWKLLASAPEPGVLHTMIPPPQDADFDLSGSAPGPAMLSPDETMVTFTARDGEGITRLYLRHLDREESVSLSGTENAAYPFWSPDSQFIGFFTPNASQKLRKVAVSGGPPVTLCAASNGKGGSWNEDGTIIFAPSHNTPIHRVPSIGGEPEAITEIGEGENSHRHPRFLPNGQDYLYLARLDGSATTHPIRLGSLGGAEPRTLTDSECHAEYVSGHLLTAREGVLMATPFDLGAGELTGGGTPLVENLLVVSSGAATGSYSVSPSGMMIFQTGFAQTDYIMQWAELDSENTSSVGTTGQVFHPRMSPDGTYAMVEVRGESQEGTDLWLVDLATGLRTRFTFEAGDETGACWTPDGESIIYVARTTESNRIMQQPVEGVGGAAILYESELQMRTTSVHPDGTTILFDQSGDDGDVNIYLLPLTGEAEPRPVLATPETEGGGRFSPDGRWIAYHGSSASTWDVFVMPAAGGPRKWQVTTTGAVYPQWKADGSELLVSLFNGSVSAYEADTRGDSFHVGSSRQAAVTEGPTAQGVAYSVHPDGQRILRAGPDPTSQAEISYIHLVTDWQRGLVQ